MLKNPLSTTYFSCGNTTLNAFQYTDGMCYQRIITPRRNITLYLLNHYTLNLLLIKIHNGTIICTLLKFNVAESAFKMVLYDLVNESII